MGKTSKPDPAVVAAAQTLIDHGAVFVVTQGKKTPFKWSRPDGKTKGSDRERVIRNPATNEARPHFTAEESASWLASADNRAVGVLVSTIDDGLCVVDYDDGVESAEALSALMGEPLALTTSTGGSGKHAWYRWPADASGKGRKVFTRKCGLMMPGVSGACKRVKADVTFSNGIVVEGAAGLIEVAKAVAAAEPCEGRMGDGVWQVLERLAMADDHVSRGFEEWGRQAKPGTLHNTLLSVAGKVMHGEMGRWGPDGFLARLLVAAALGPFGAVPGWRKDAERAVADIAGKAAVEWEATLQRMAAATNPRGHAPVVKAAVPAAAEPEAKVFYAPDVGAAPSSSPAKARVVLAAKPSLITVGQALDSLGWGFCADTIRNERMVNFAEGHPPDAWETATDDVLTKMRWRLACECDYVAGAQGEQTAPFEMKDNSAFLRPPVLARCDANPRNPLTGWLERCRSAAEGADESLLETWLGEAFDFDPEFPADAARWLSKRLICAVVGRIVEPGTPWPHMIILQGMQGIGKSLLAREILPGNGDPEWDRFYTNEFHFGMHEGQMAHAVKGKVVVECDEMRGRVKEIEDMRSFITRTVDGTGVRLAYRRDPAPWPRTCVLIGTANHPDCIPGDSHGDRRYFVLPLRGKHDPSTLDGQRACGEHVRRVMAERRETLVGLALRVLERDREESGRWGRMLIDYEGMGPVFMEAAEAYREVDEWVDSFREFVENWERNLADLGCHFKTQELAEFARIVSVSTTEPDYEVYATKARRYHKRVREILTGKEFGLVEASRRIPQSDGKWVSVRGWWHRDSDVYLLGDAEWEKQSRADRREMLSIPDPVDLKRKASGGGDYRQEDGLTHFRGGQD